MRGDPIVEEIRMYRQKYASQFNHDVDAICEDILRKQRESGRKVVTRQSKPATTVPKDQPAV